ncbi:MAG TPA: hypothetical protein VJV23_06115 [Candidatus Polarisedimenticolia bacterium]|nr:hypothetical protein [Candidatus Polarisedimenticolia bacterium]
MKLLLAAGLAAACAAAAPPAAPTEAEYAQAVGELSRAVSEARGLAFTSAVPVGVMEAPRAREFLERKLREDYPPEAILAEQAAYRAFGLLGPDDDLERLFLDLLVEQASGFYDPDEKRLFLVHGVAFPGVSLVHELVHALQDQNFGLGGLLDRAVGNDDRLRAVQAMIEGEAMRLSGALTARDGPAARWAARLDSLAASRPRSGRAAGRPYPSILRSELSFPYVEGRAWAEAVNAAGRVSAMDELFRKPPDSTEQILHPSRSWPARDTPSSPPPSALPDLGGFGYRLIKGNTWGEFGVIEILGGDGDQSAVAAAAGWDGDLYGVYAGPEGAAALAWVSVWDSAADGEEFRAAAAAWLGRRGRRGAASLHPSGRLAAVVEGFDPDLSRRVEAALLRSALDEASR